MFNSLLKKCICVGTAGEFCALGESLIFASEFLHNDRVAILVGLLRWPRKIF